MPGQYIQGNLYQASSQACIVDLAPPTFAGITALVAKNNGALQATWAAASDPSTPIEYLIYIALGSVNALALFQPANLVKIAPENFLSSFIFYLGFGTWPDANSPIYVIKNQVYTVGVRAKDAVGNIDANTALLTVTAIGSVDLATIFQTLQTQFAADHANFVADHAAFVADDAAFDVDHANFVADHAAFVADDAAFDVDHANLVSAISDLQGIVDNINIALPGEITGEIGDPDEIIEGVVSEEELLIDGEIEVC